MPFALAAAEATSTVNSGILNPRCSWHGTLHNTTNAVAPEQNDLTVAAKLNPADNIYGRQTS